MQNLKTVLIIDCNTHANLPIRVYHQHFDKEYRFFNKIQNMQIDHHKIILNINKVQI